MKTKTKKPVKVAIIMGSDSDYVTMKGAEDALKDFNIPFHTEIVSAHRTPEKMVKFAKNARKKGLQVIIAGAGGAAHLPGMVAALTELPVIGVPVPHGHLKGEDALLSIVQMPKGVPVATVAIGNSFNAGVLAAKILAAGGLKQNQPLLKRLAQYRKKLELKVKKMKPEITKPI